jgi:dihydroxyacetone kinase-like predicted kinase
MALGDSLVVVGGDGLWNVHVHTDDVGAALEAGLASGRPHRVRVTHFGDQLQAQAHPSPAEQAGGGKTPPRVVLAVTYADGLAELFEQAGSRVLRATSGARPRTEQLLAAVRAAVRATAATEVVLLANDSDVVPAAEAAAGLAEREDGTRVAVVPTRAQVQGLAALAVHESGRSFERDLVEMTAAARHARAGAVSVADRALATAAGRCRPGDVLGEVEGEVTVVGRDQEQVALEVLDRLLGGGGELVTIVAGAEAGALARACEEHVRHHHPTVEVVGYDGGQERYALLFGVE